MLSSGVLVQSFETAIICKCSHSCCGALSNLCYRLIVTVVENESKGKGTLAYTRTLC
jgi:hypothetical protein